MNHWWDFDAFWDLERSWSLWPSLFITGRHISNLPGLLIIFFFFRSWNFKHDITWNLYKKILHKKYIIFCRKNGHLHSNRLPIVAIGSRRLFWFAIGSHRLNVFAIGSRWLFLFAINSLKLYFIVFTNTWYTGYQYPKNGSLLIGILDEVRRFSGLEKSQWPMILTRRFFKRAYYVVFAHFIPFLGQQSN